MIFICKREHTAPHELDYHGYILFLISVEFLTLIESFSSQPGMVRRTYRPTVGPASSGRNFVGNLGGT